MSKDLKYLAQWAGYLAVLLLLCNWFAGGADKIIETPPEPLDGQHQIR